MWRVSQQLAEREAERDEVGRPQLPGEYRQYQYLDRLRARVAAKKRQTGRERSLRELKNAIEATRERLVGLERRLAEMKKAEGK